MTSSSEPIFRVEHLSLAYPGRRGQPPAQILTDVSVDVERGGALTLVGPSGSGRDKVLVLATAAGGAYIGTLAGAAANGAPVKGALIGGGAGVAAGLIAILLTRGPEAELPRGTMLDVVFDHPLVLDPDHLLANEPGKLSQPLAPAAIQQQTDRRERPASRTLPGFPFPFLRF